MRRILPHVALLGAAALAGSAAFAVDPPLLLNYQGVLRDTAGDPENGAFDMQFAFYDDADSDCGDGTLLLTDSHLAAASHAVQVTAGLFDVALGSGSLLPGAEANLSGVFASHASVFMEVRINGGGGFETLCPRVRVVASAYSINTQSLSGKPAASFLDTSATDQTKAGDLAVSTLTLTDNDLGFGAGAAVYAIPTQLAIAAGDQDTDSLFLHAGNTADDGSIHILGDGPLELRAGSGLFRFINGATGGITSTINAAGDLTTGNILAGAATLLGDNLFFGSGGRIQSTPGALFIAPTGGPEETDAVNIWAGNSFDDGGMRIEGTGRIQFHAGNGNFQFLDNNLVLADLDSEGDLAVDGDFSLGGAVRFPAGAMAFEDGLGFQVRSGSAATSDLRLNATADPDDGSILIDGSGPLDLRPGSGLVRFFNGATGLQTFSVDSSGDVGVEGDLEIDGPAINLGNAATVFVNPSGLNLHTYGSDTADIFLRAGNDATDGEIQVLGDSAINFRAGNGSFNFYDAGTGGLLASIAPGGTITATDDLMALGNELRFGVLGARVTAGALSLEVQAGDANTDNLFLRAGNEVTDGAVDIFGDGNLNLRAGNGTFTFANGATEANLATLGSTGSFNVAQDLISGADLIVGGNEVHLGTPGSVRFVRNTSNDDVWIARDEDNNHAASTFSIFTNVGERQLQINDGPDAPAFFDGNVNANGLDYAEAFWVSDPSLVAGEVVMFDPERPGYIARAAEAYSTRLAGVISTQPGFVTGGSFNAEEETDPALAQEMKRAMAAEEHDTAKEIMLALQQKRQERQRPVALAGRLPVKVDATYGAIEPGDHLTSSPTPGHAMRMSQAGPSIGVALEGFDEKRTGTILAFVQRGQYTPTSLITETQEAQARLADAVAARTPDPVTGVQVMPSNLQLVLDGSGEEEARFSVFRDGAAAEPRAEVFRVDERGNVWAQGAFRPRSMDVAEAFAVSEPVEAGDVLVVDREHPGKYARSRTPSDPAVIGVVAADPGVLLGGDMSRLLGESPDLVERLAAARRGNDRQEERRVWAEVERRFQATHAAVAMTGTVLVKADAAYGSIRPGDLLVAAPTPGHAMIAPSPMQDGAVFGKALEPLERGVGSIRMLVVLR